MKLILILLALGAIGLLALEFLVKVVFFAMVLGQIQW
jgi:hypothetical protein